MSLESRPIPLIPELTAKVARRAFRKGNVYMQMRDVLGTFFTDDQFTDLYPADGQPAYAPWRLALVSVMQFAENLSDRQAADAVRSRIDWKYALSLELSDEGYDISAFTIDWENRTVTCPRGHTSNPWTMRDHRRDHQLTRVKFKRVECEPCPVHNLCTKHPRRTLSFHEEGVFKAVQRRKEEQHTDEWRKQYGKRAGVEGTVSQCVFALAMRRSRYRGLNKTYLQFVLTSAAMNLTRVVNWLNEKPRSKTRFTRFGKLAA